jgi:hypothetical protein
MSANIQQQQQQPWGGRHSLNPRGPVGAYNSSPGGLAGSRNAALLDALTAQQNMSSQRYGSAAATTGRYGSNYGADQTMGLTIIKAVVMEALTISLIYCQAGIRGLLTAKRRGHLILSLGLQCEYIKSTYYISTTEYHKLLIFFAKFDEESASGWNSRCAGKPN